MSIRSALALSASADAYNACQRLYPVFEAELLSDAAIQDGDMDDAVQVVGAEFVWDGPPPEAPAKDKKGKKGGKKEAAPQPVAEPKPQESSWKLKDVNLHIPRGQLTAIVGAFRSPFPLPSSPMSL